MNFLNRASDAYRRGYYAGMLAQRYSFHFRNPYRILGTFENYDYAEGHKAGYAHKWAFYNVAIKVRG